jgi:anti-sigma B factor antagonist
MSFDIMPSKADPDSNVEQLAITGELCVFHAAEIKPRLLDFLEPGKIYDVDLSSISEVDTAGVQLLLLAKREAARVGCQLNFLSHSTPVLELMELFQLSRDFGDPVLLLAEAQHEFR